MVSKFFECDHCGGYCAHLVDAPHANSSKELKRLAENILPDAKKMGLPTWILGTPMSQHQAVEIVGCRMLQVYPEEEFEVKALTPQEFDKILKSYQLDCSQHCGLEKIQQKANNDHEKIASLLHEFLDYHRGLQTPPSVVIDQIPPYMSKFQNLMELCPNAKFKELMQKYPNLKLYKGMLDGP